MNECEHKNRRYENALLLSIPPQQKWICTDCGAEGLEMAGTISSVQLGDALATITTGKIDIRSKEDRQDEIDETIENMQAALRDFRAAIVEALKPVIEVVEELWGIVNRSKDAED